MTKLTLFGAMTLSAALLASCSTVDRFNPFSGSGEDEADAADKAGRISMLSAESELSADPDLVSSAVILPDAVDVRAWNQAGRTSQKLPGHVRAGGALDVDWTWGRGEGSSNNEALTVAPLAADGKVFVFDADQTIHAIDAETGRSLWKHELSSENSKDRRAFGGGMAIINDRLIAASGFGYVTALELGTGEPIWKQEMEAPMTGSPTVVEGRVFVASNNNELYSLSLETGEVEWTDQAIAETARVLASPSPAAIDDFVVAPFSSGEVIAYLPSNGRRLWSESLTRAGRFTPISAINDIASRPVLANGLVFASSQSGVLAAIDGRSGTRVWSLPFGTTQAPLVVGEYLFAVGVDAQLICIDAASGRVIWVQQLTQFEKEKDRKGRISYSGPLLASNRLVTLSSDGRISAYSPQTGELLEEKKLVNTGRFGANAGFFLEPIAYEGRIYALADNGKLFSIR